MRTYDVAIIGGGVIGVSIAHELAEEKLDIIVLDRQQPGREASWAAAGMLSPAPHVPEDATLTPLGNESLRIYPQFVAQIESESGSATHFARGGSLEIFFGEHGEIERDRTVAENRKLGVPCEAISAAGARELESSINPDVRAAMWFPQEATIDPRLLMDALLIAAQRRGVEIRPDCLVTKLLYEGDRCHGVVANGEMIRAEYVIVAAGCFCAAIAKNTADGSDVLARYAPTHPVRGQMIALQMAGMNLQRVVRAKGHYVLPRRNCRIVAGSTLEEAGFEKESTEAGVREILAGILKLVPELAGADVVETWAGLRPGSPDGLPILGPTGMEGLLIATGHYRNGILLAPITAKLIREWIMRGKTEFDTDRFSPMRFARSPALGNASGATLKKS